MLKQTNAGRKSVLKVRKSSRNAIWAERWAQLSRLEKFIQKLAEQAAYCANYNWTFDLYQQSHTF